MAILLLSGIDTLTGQKVDSSPADAAFCPGGLKIGSSATTPEIGDIVSSDGTRSAVFDASTTTFSISDGTNTFSITEDAITRTGSTGTATFSGGVFTTNFNGGDLRFQIGGTSRWQVTSSGHFVGTTDNTLDIGASGATRPRTAYLGTALNVGAGITPSTANGDIVAGDGTRSLLYDASIASCYSSTSANEGCQFLAINTKASGTRTLSRAFFQLSVDGDKGGFLIGYSAGWSQGGVFDIASSIQLQSSALSSGGVSINTSGAHPLRFGTTDALRWQITSAGHFLAGADNTLDIGASGATRPRTGYFGTSAVVGTTAITQGSATLRVGGLPLPQVLAQITGIVLTSTGDTLLYTVPSGQSAVITSIVVRPTTATAAVGDAAVSVGTNASTYDDIIPSQTLTGLNATTESFILEAGGIVHTAAATEVIRFQVDSADTGTTLTATVELLGYLI